MIYFFKDEVYEFNYIVLEGKETWNYTSIMKFLKKKKIEINPSFKSYFENNFDDNVQGTCLHFGNVVFLFIKQYENKPMWYSTLSHELFHAIDFILNYLEIKLCHDTQEVYAYYIGFLTNKVLSLINK